mgnify:CR=1 FL=1
MYVILQIFPDGKLNLEYDLSAEGLPQYYRILLKYSLQAKFKSMDGSSVKFGFAILFCVIINKQNQKMHLLFKLIKDAFG